MLLHFMPPMKILLARWKSAVITTSPFHQFRAYRTFRCAAKQTLPLQEQPQVQLLTCLYADQRALLH